ncbi:MAG TPA: recombinase zinc beta ribbon domain-containing protein [Chloroflexota bacterium]
MRTLMTGLAFPESPRWHDGRLWVSDWGAQEIVALDIEGTREVVVRVPFPSIPMCIDFLHDGRLLLVSPSEGLLRRREPDGSLETHADLSGLARTWNEVVLDGRGNAYVNGGPFDGPGIVALVAAKGRTFAPRPAEEHVVVENFCEPIFTRAERDAVLRVAADIRGTPPRRAASPHLLSGLVECTCGTKMYRVHNYVTTKRGRYRVTYYRCRRASSKGTCAAKLVPAAVVERAVIDELRRLGLDSERVTALAGDAQATFEAVLQPLLERRGQMARDLECVTRRLDSLLELAEDRLVSKQEFAARKARLEAERTALEGDLAATEGEIEARTETFIDAGATARGLRRLGEVFDELGDVRDRRHLLATCSPPASTGSWCGGARSSCASPPSRCSRCTATARTVPMGQPTGGGKFPEWLILRPKNAPKVGPKTAENGPKRRAGPAPPDRKSMMVGAVRLRLWSFARKSPSTRRRTFVVGHRGTCARARQHSPWAAGPAPAASTGRRRPRWGSSPDRLSPW